MRLAPAYLISLNICVIASSVFPEPVAIWIRARGLSVLNDFSRFVIASTLFCQRLGITTSFGSVEIRERRVDGFVSSAAL